jgi:hypothetical protein
VTDKEAQKRNDEHASELLLALTQDKGETGRSSRTRRHAGGSSRR